MGVPHHHVFCPPFNLKSNGHNCTEARHSHTPKLDTLYNPLLIYLRGTKINTNTGIKHTIDIPNEYKLIYRGK